MLHHHKWRNESGEMCDRMCHRSVNHSYRAGIYLDPWAISDFSKGRPAWGKICYERTTLLLCHVLQTLLFFLCFLLLSLLNCGLIFHLSKYIFLPLLGRKFFMTEQVSAMARGLVFAGCLSVPFCRRHISGTPAAFLSHFSRQNLQTGWTDELFCH